ncbi:MAG: ribbon-helix-helix protein, CopG family [Nitrososphaerota archaeon]
MRRPGKEAVWSIRLKPEIDELLEREARKRGVSKNDLVKSIILDWAYRNGYNKVLHFNFRNATITLWDFLLNQTVDLTYTGDRRLFCEHCRAHSCGHIYYAVTSIPEVARKVKRGEIRVD